jgi:cell division septation protein DedD
MNRTNQFAERVHERARTLAAEAIDAALESSEAAWLAEHLNSCEECREVGAEYRAIHDELHSLAAPVPPRDLWARTSAALDAVDRASAPAASRSGPGLIGPRFAFDRSLSFSAVAVGLVAVVAVVSLIVQGPLSFSPSGAGNSGGIALVTPTPGPSPEAPLAYYKDTGYWLESQGDQYSIVGSSTQCTAGAETCSVTKSGGETLGSIRSTTSVSAAIAPGAGQAAVWTDSKIVIMPLSGQLPADVSIDNLTPGPQATPSPTAVPETLSPTQPAETPTAEATLAPTPVTTESASASDAATQTPTPSPTAASTPTPAPTQQPIVDQPIAILDGYEIVGRDPVFSPDGSWVAFAARTVGSKAGPDVFVWRAGMTRAEPITTRHADLFSGWFGGRILLSEFNDSAQVTSLLHDPATGLTDRIERSMLLPSVDPTGRYIVYWAGTVRGDADTGLWQPVGGHLEFDLWANMDLEPTTLGPVVPSPSPTEAPSPTPTVPAQTEPAGTSPTPEATESAPTDATDTAAASALPTLAPTPRPVPQMLPLSPVPSIVDGLVVRWDATGEHLAIWVADTATPGAGTLTLFAVDGAAGLVQTDMHLLVAANVLANLQFDDANLVYTSSADGKTYVVPIPKPVPTPTPAPTPTPTSPAPEASPTPESGASPTDLATDQPSI